MECSYTVLFEQLKEGGFVAFCPALPWIIVDGGDYEQAYRRVKEAISGYLGSLIQDGVPLPPDKNIVLQEQVHISLPNGA